MKNNLLTSAITTIFNFIGFSVAAISIFLSGINLTRSLNFTISVGPNIEGIKIGSYGFVVAIIIFFFSYLVLNMVSDKEDLINDLRLKVTLLLIFLVGLSSLIISSAIFITYFDLASTISKELFDSIFHIAFLELGLAIFSFYFFFSTRKKLNNYYSN